MSAITFGQLLRDVRIQAGLSQNALSARAGVSASYVNRLEVGKRTPKRRTLRKLADALDCGGDGEELLMEAAGFMVVDGRLTPELRELAEILADTRLGSVTRDRLTEVLRLAVDYGRMRCADKETAR